MGTKKNFVLDTNVILHDYNCLKNFQENDIYLPIVVLEELDKFKKGNEQINYNAREFVRELDLITDDSLFTHGAPLGEGLGKLFIVKLVGRHLQTQLFHRLTGFFIQIAKHPHTFIGMHRNRIE